jgi:hypothetical protein
MTHKVNSAELGMFTDNQMIVSPREAEGNNTTFSLYLPAEEPQNHKD